MHDPAEHSRQITARLLDREGFHGEVWDAYHREAS